MYEAYYSTEAYELAKWAFQENKRVKASKVMNAATQVEYRYRRYYFIPDNVSPRPAYGLRNEMLRLDGSCVMKTR